MNEFFTWSMLSTFAGASMATVIITQFIKGVFSKIPTQIVSYFIAIAVLLLTTLAIDGPGDWASWAIIPFDAVLISLSSNGSYSAITCMKGNKNK